MNVLGNASAWVGAIAGAAAALAAVGTLLIMAFRGWRSELKTIGSRLGRRVGKLDKQLRSLELSAAGRDAAAAARAEHQATHGWVAEHVEKALARHEEGCRAREWEENVSHVGDEAERPPRTRGGV